MPASYRPCALDQVMLLPAAPQNWLPAGHLAHFINDTVDALELKAFYARYEGGGSRNQPFHLAMMVKVLIYAYATGVFSSRKIERRLHEDLAFRMLAAGNFPRHRTICDFRAFHPKELSELFVQVVRLAREMGLVKLGTVAIDGTKLKANASLHKAMSDERMKQAEAELKAQIDALLARAKATDETEANESELDLPAEIERRQTRLAAIQEARERLDKRQREADLEREAAATTTTATRGGPDGQPRGGRYKREFGVPEDKAHENFTDPDSRIMKRAGGGYDPAYNAQSAVDEAAHIIVAAELDNTAPDANWLLPMIRAVGENLGELPELGLADAGYRSEDNLKSAPIELVVALGREGKAHAEINAERNPHTAAMAEKLKTDEGRAACRKRKWIAEPPNGWIKNVLGFRQFSLRGLHRAQAEWKLECMALNLRRMAVLSAG
jgi:transposase